MILSLNHVSLRYVLRPILDDVSFVVNENEKWGVVGLNGAGKSTLMKVLAQKLKPDSGEVSLVPGFRISYCAQDFEFHEEDTIFEAVVKSLDKKDDIQEFEIKSILNKLKLTDYSMKIKTCSGGQKKRVALAASLIKPADLYLLDEPTNHLDQEMILWLEKFLIRMNKSLVLVTHDRYFLNRITNHMVEIDRGHLYMVDGNYTDYLEQKELRQQQAMASERKRQNFLRTEIEWIRRGAQARSTKSKDRIARFEKIQAMEGIKHTQKLEMDSVTTRLGRKTIEINHISKRYGNQVLIHDFSYLVQRHDRIGIIGNNGSGKTTLLKMIMNEVATDEGTIIIGDTVKIGYFAQDSSLMNPQVRVIDYLREFGETVTTANKEVITASQMLERFLFSKDEQYTLIKNCSGGQKRRLYLLSILIQAPNILLLDEPTNDLDTETLTILEEYLETFSGAVLAVSHDRYFLDKTCDKLFIFEDSNIRILTMDYSTYLESMENNKPETPVAKKSIETKPISAKTKLSYNEKKELEQLEKELPILEKNIEEIHSALENTTEFSLIQTLSKELEIKNRKIEEKTERWMELSEKN